MRATLNTLKKIVHHFLMMSRSLLTKRRFVLLTPWFFKNQLVIDKQKNELLKFKTQDYIDWLTLSQIYYSENYDIKRLSLSSSLLKDYNYIMTSSKIPLILDLGANCGFSVRYFADEYPEARIVAFEPDKSNFILAKLNNNRKKVDWYNNAIGNIKSIGNLTDPGLGNNSYRVSLSSKGNIQILSLDKLLENYIKEGFVPFIVKKDIEGYEKELFSSNLSWIDHVPIIIIELHDWLFPAQCNSKNFLNAIANLNRDFVYIGENIFSIRIEGESKHG